MNRNLFRGVGIGICLILLGSVYAATGRAAAQYRAKAQFLYWLTTLVSWPDQTAAASHKPIIVGVIGDDAFASILDDAVKGKNSRGRQLYISRASYLDNLSRYHLVYVAPSELRHLSDVLEQTTGLPILTVTDDDVNVPPGIIVVLKFGADGRLTPVIHVKAAKRAGLTVSSRLMKLAETIQD